MLMFGMTSTGAGASTPAPVSPPRASLPVDPDVRHTMKIIAACENRSTREVTNDALRAYIHAYMTAHPGIAATLGR